MLTNISIYLFVLSIIYLLRFCVEFLIKFFSEEPSTLKLTNTESVFLYLSISYLITFIIIWPNV
jgi:hypothetical protein